MIHQEQEQSLLITDVEKAKKFQESLTKIAEHYGWSKRPIVFICSHNLEILHETLKSIPDTLDIDIVVALDGINLSQATEKFGSASDQVVYASEINFPLQSPDSGKQIIFFPDPQDKKLGKLKRLGNVIALYVKSVNQGSIHLAEDVILMDEEGRYNPSIEKLILERKELKVDVASAKVHHVAYSDNHPNTSLPISLFYHMANIRKKDSIEGSGYVIEGSLIAVVLYILTEYPNSWSEDTMIELVFRKLGVNIKKSTVEVTNKVPPLRKNRDWKRQIKRWLAGTGGVLNHYYPNPQFVPVDPEVVERTQSPLYIYAIAIIDLLRQALESRRSISELASVFLHLMIYPFQLRSLYKEIEPVNPIVGRQGWE